MTPQPSTGVRETIETLVERIFDQGLSWLASALLFAMMILTFVDVVGREFFLSPVLGGFEITELMMGALVFLGLPLITAKDGHVTVDLLDGFLPETFKRVQRVCVNFVSCVAVGVISWRLWIKAEDAFEYGDQTAFLFIPLFPLIYFMSVMAGLACVVLFFKTLRPGGQRPGGAL